MSGGKSSEQGSQSGKFNTTSTNSSPYAGWLGNFGMNLSNEGNALLAPFLQQLQSALAGKYTKGQIPIINNAVSAQRQAGSQSFSQAKSNLATTGVANSPFAATELSGIEQNTNQAIGQAPIGVLQQMLGMIPGAAVSTVNTGIQSFADAARALFTRSTSGTSSGSSAGNGKSSGFDIGSFMSGLGDLSAGLPQSGSP